MPKKILHEYVQRERYERHDDAGRQPLFTSDLWRERDLSPGDGIVLVENFDGEYLDDEFALLWTSSGWKAGMDNGHGWKQWYKHQIQFAASFAIRKPTR